MGRVYKLFHDYRQEMREIISRYPVRNARLFGSVARGDDVETSDLDFLVVPRPNATLLDLGGLHAELESLVTVKVDLVTPSDLSMKVRIAAEREASLCSGSIPLHPAVSTS